MESLASQFVEFGSAGILLALFFGTFFSEDLACISAGSLIAALLGLGWGVIYVRRLRQAT